MTDARVDDLLHLLETEDPLEVGRVRWSATRLEDRRYSLIYRVVPRAEAERNMRLFARAVKPHLQALDAGSAATPALTATA